MGFSYITGAGAVVKTEDCLYICVYIYVCLVRGYSVSESR